MTKAKAARAQLPGQPSDAEPVQPAATDHLVFHAVKVDQSTFEEQFPPHNPVHDEPGELEPLLMDMGGGVIAPVDPAPYIAAASDTQPDQAPPLDPALGTAGALPPVDPLPPEPRLPHVLAAFTSLELVRSLPEVVGDIETQPIEFAPGSIERFKASDTDRRTLEVIALPGMGFAARAVTTEEA